MSYDIVVLGLGYVGLPLAQAACAAGLRVAGFDPSEKVVSGLAAGRSHVDDLSDDDIALMLSEGFHATNDDSVIAQADAAVICVPTPLSKDGGPDLTAVFSATRSITPHLHAGMLVVLESTTYPGTTDEDLRPILEASGLTAGVDFNLAFSPERIDPGNPVYGMVNTPKVVGGYTDACRDRAVVMYSRFVDTVVAVSGTREAETAKLLENTYRHVNIAMVNEMARFCHELDIDVWEVIAAASSKPFGFQAFYPGPGVGGHCIPIDPNYLSYKVKSELGYRFSFVELAQEINDGMPRYVVQRLMETLNEDGLALKGATVLVLGVTYKPDIADQRESPAEHVAVHLLRRGAVLTYHDPHVTDWTIAGQQIPLAEDLMAAAANADIVLILQDHRSYDLPGIARAAKRVFDTRGKVKGANVERL